MSDFITAVFSNLTTVVTNSATALKTAFINIFYTNPDATSGKTVSDLMLFVGTMMGLTIGLGVLYKILRLVRIGRR